MLEAGPNYFECRPIQQRLCENIVRAGLIFCIGFPKDGLFLNGALPCKKHVRRGRGG